MLYIYVLTLLLATYIRTYIRIRTVIYVTLPITSKQASKVYIARIDCLCIYCIVIIIMYTFVRSRVFNICGF